MKLFLSLVATAVVCLGQSSSLDFLNHNRSILDAHNCYPYDGQFADRIDRALSQKFPIGIEQDIAWAPFFPLGSGFPGRAKVAEHPAVVEAAAALGCTPAQAGLAWLLHHDPHILLIPGTASVAHLKENMAVSGVHLDPATAATLDALPAAS